MFRKIHSNRDPRDTLVKEIRKEFGRYFDAAGKSAGEFLVRRPRWSFGMMVLLLLTSAIMAIWFNKDRTSVKEPYSTKVRPISDGFSQILTAGDQIRSMLKLRHDIDSISAKKYLNAADSLALDSALDCLQAIQKSLK